MGFPWSKKARPILARWPVGISGGPAVAVARSYEGMVREAYLNNPVAQRAVRLVGESAGAVAIDVSDDHAAGLLARPNAMQSGAAFVETLACQLLLHGNAYIEVARGADGQPAALYALRPDRVTVEADAGGWPVAHNYRAGTALTRWPVEAADGRGGLIHIKGFHPTDDHYGLGCLGACAQAVAVHNAAAVWNRTLLDNAARPSGALTYDAGGGTLSAEQFQRLKDELETMFSGKDNAGRPILLEGGLKWQPLSLTPAEMDFMALREGAAREIALAFGVPPMLLGLPGDSTHANYREANVALWRLTVLPLLGKILGGIEATLRGWWPGLTIAADLDRIPALSGDRERLWAQVSAADFLSREEKRAAVGY